MDGLGMSISREFPGKRDSVIRDTEYLQQIPEILVLKNSREMGFPMKRNFSDFQETEYRYFFFFLGN